MNLTKLRALHAVIATGSVSVAASRLHLTQPAISRALSSLEEEVGFKLFVRAGSGLVPTPQGEAYFRASESVLSHIEELDRTAKDIAGNRGARFRVAIMPQVARGLVPLVIAKFCAEHPQVTISTDIRYRREPVSWDATRQFDIAVLKLPIETPLASVNVLNVVTATFAELSAVVVVPKGHRLESSHEISVEDILDEPFIAFDRASSLRHAIDDLFRKYGREPRIKVETTSGLLSCELVERGMGVSIVDPFSALMADPRYVVAKSFGDDLFIQYGFGYPLDYRPTELSVSFCAITCDVVTTLMQQHRFCKGKVFESTKSRIELPKSKISVKTRV